MISKPSTSIVNNFLYDTNLEIPRITNAAQSATDNTPQTPPISISSESQTLNSSTRTASRPSSLPVVYAPPFAVSPSLPPLPLPLPSSLESQSPATAPENSSAADPSSVCTQRLIPGTRFPSPTATASFLSYFSCLCCNGTWQRNNTPRFLPWPVPRPPSAALEACDARHIRQKGRQKGARHVAWGKADDVVRNGGKESDWLVRPGLKYEWVVDPFSCMPGDANNTTSRATSGRSNHSRNKVTGEDQSDVFHPAWEAVNPDLLIDKLAGEELRFFL